MLISSATSTPSAISVASLSRSSTSRVSNFANLEISSKISLRGFRARVSSKAVVKIKAMAELVEDKESIKNVQNIIRLKKSSSEIDDNDNVGHSLTFIDVRSEKELLWGIRKEQEAGRLPSNVAAGLEELYKNYRDAVLKSGHPNAHEIILSNMSVAFDRMLLEVEDPFAFSPYHKAIREPFDYYLFGQNYIRPLIDFRRSYVGNLSVFADMEDKLNQGHNVILISNHQSEADPAVISLLLETTNSYISENLTYVAGDRVLTDPLCRPFSMGRNLVCVYSKKHMNDNPELADMKRRSNTRSLKEMALLLRGGSQIIWIAPSGGRDRPDPSTGEWFPAPFDASSVDNIRRLADHSGPPGHIYPLTLTCHDIMPPPLQVEKEIGEKRVISYHGVGLSVAPEMSFNQVAANHENPEEAKAAFSQALYNSVTEHYNTLKAAIHGKQGLSASTSTVVLSQPWN